MVNSIWIAVPARATRRTGLSSLREKCRPIAKSRSATPISASNSISCTSPTVGPPVFGPTMTPASMYPRIRGSPSRRATIPPRKAATRMSAMSPAIPTPLFYTITPAVTRNGTKESVSLEHQDLGSHLAFLYTQQSEGVLRLPSFVGRAAGVEEQEAVFVLQKGGVRVSEDDYTRLGKATCQTPAAALSTARVVDHAYSSATEAKLQRLGEVHLRRGFVCPDGAGGGVEGPVVE